MLFIVGDLAVHWPFSLETYSLKRGNTRDDSSGQQPYPFNNDIVKYAESKMSLKEVRRF